MEVTTIFSPEAINQQTGRILNFPMFKNSPVLSRFLEFVVTETVHNRAFHIKEYSIAINVLNRSRHFNPNGDSIVRIHAGRLRRALQDYYLTQGIYDPIRIRIPKGCYVPDFSESGPVKLAPDPLNVLIEHVSKPLVAVFPLRAAMEREGVNEFSLLLKEQLSEELLRFHDISVIGYYSDEVNAKLRQNILEAGRLAGAHYIITGSLSYIRGYLRVLISLLATETGEVLYCKSFETNIISGEPFEINDEIAQNCNAFAADCYGMILGVQKHIA